MMTIEEIISNLCELLNYYDYLGIMEEEEKTTYLKTVQEYQTWHEIFIEQ